MNKKQQRALDLFFYWINERHAIYLRRKAGGEWPWTSDKILQEFKFTNVYRELDRETVNFHGEIDGMENGPDKLYHMILYRAFNVLGTYRSLTRGVNVKTEKKIVQALRRRQDQGKKIFTGAYIITNAGQSRPKIELMAEALGVAYRGRGKLWTEMVADGTMEGCTRILTAFPMQGPFTAYEVICDMRHQRGMLDKAPDRRTWANLGPGARRGINRIVAGNKNSKAFPRTSDYVDFMAELLKASRTRIASHVVKERLPFEMREIEHSLCEFDKYMRVKNGEGTPRSRYRRET